MKLPALLAALLLTSCAAVSAPATIEHLAVGPVSDPFAGSAPGALQEVPAEPDPAAAEVGSGPAATENRINIYFVKQLSWSCHIWSLTIPFKSVQ